MPSCEFPDDKNKRRHRQCGMQFIRNTLAHGPGVEAAADLRADLA